ncbi:MAG: hypothetical protein LQ350_000194 [Teloschistes chrysophthalmus]|nr:MAG: hypothetical protein LQ350_000194 [Niorma chrysophthalma]
MLSTTAHTYGPDCSLQPDSNTFTRRASAASIDAPLIRAHFFYSSPLPIDDPLSPVPPPSNKPAAVSRVPPKPFSVADNRALEEAWQSLEKAKIERHHAKNSRSRSKRDRSSRATDTIHSEAEPFATLDELKEKDNEGAHKHSPGDPHLVLCDNPAHIPFDSAMPVGTDEIGRDEFDAGIPQAHRTPFHKHDKAVQEADLEPGSPSSGRMSLHLKRPAADTPYGSSPSERDTTGTPFLRVASRLRSRSRPRKTSPNEAQEHGPNTANEAGDHPDVQLAESDPQSEGPDATTMEGDTDFGCSVHQSDALNRDRRLSRRRKVVDDQVTVPVGISRLHLVEMPALKMGPIYWDPVHDISSVVRGTWFYKDTMFPVPPDVANQLEEGYEYMKPWTPTYVDELNSCLEVGAEAEAKVVHRLWPETETRKEDSRPVTAKSKKSLLATATDELEPDERARKYAIKQASKPENRAAGKLEASSDSVEKKYAACSVIYVNVKDAQILRPNQLPSVSRSRKPLGPIRKGRTIGDPVVRGFDYKVWEKLHPPSKKRGVTAEPAMDSIETTKAAVSRAPSISPDRRKSCVACMSADERSKPTDLVLVIHGIGQKLSERVESFHFTHAINAFRRQINVELESASVKPWLRQDLGGIMVLPINWRATLKFEDGGPKPNPNQKDETSSKNEYTLKDITADSIPAVRNLISDVMLDIPYYLSHHKPKMIEAVVREANRVYRLWCRNNPGFDEDGRVHLIAHSLGSVMALDILSKQPTLPPKLDLKRNRIRNDIFEFDTKGLFFCGSPAGFFLLLNKAPLLPRRGRNKPDSDGEDVNSGVAGEAGTYGCLAVDNLYNVVHYNDPIAYRVNACVDVSYHYSLQPARVPSAASTWGQYLSSAFRGSKAATIAPTAPILPTTMDMPARPGVNRLPTTVELETHDFTQEELAEKRMFLLNDNGQIDFTLRSGGGPLEIQYLNMLSAHSSYWVLQDFVRFLVVEIGRKQGKESTVPAVRARKKTWGKK